MQEEIFAKFFMRKPWVKEIYPLDMYTPNEYNQKHDFYGVEIVDYH